MRYAVSRHTLGDLINLLQDMSYSLDMECQFNINFITGLMRENCTSIISDGWKDMKLELEDADETI